MYVFNLTPTVLFRISERGKKYDLFPGQPCQCDDEEMLAMFRKNPEAFKVQKSPTLRKPAKGKE